MKRVIILVLICALAVLNPANGKADVAAHEGKSSIASSEDAVKRVLRAGQRRKIQKKALSAVCKKIQSVNFLIKADTSNHIPGGDPRRGSYSVIGSGSNCSPCAGRCGIYYNDGTLAGSVGYYGQWSRSHGGNGCARYYGGAGGAPSHSASGIISKASKKGNVLYLQKSSSSKICYKWTASSRRVGYT